MKRLCLAPLVLAAALTGCLPFRQDVDPSDVTAGEEKLSPELTAKACLLTAESYEKHGHYPDAVKQLLRARAAKPDLVGVPHKLALLYERQGDFLAAAQEYQKALKEQPDSAKVLNDYGFFQYKQDNWKMSEAYFRKAIARDDQFTRAHINLGLTLAQQERYDQAYASFAKVLTPPEALSNVAVVQARHQKYDLAKQNFRKALDQNPSLAQPRAFLEQIELRERGVVPVEATDDPSK